MKRMSCIGDLAKRAHGRIPAFAWGFLDGGSGEEGGLTRNRERLTRIQIEPRYCTGVSPDPSTTLLGRTYAQPFGMAPVGMGNLIWPGADLALARQAHAANIPVTVSTVASTRLEDMAAAAAGNTWFQLYYARRPEINRDLLRRAWEAGIRVLSVTVDVPMTGDRRRDVRNRFTLPFRPGPGFVLDVARHPAWMLSTLAAGSPGFPNLAPYGGDVKDQTLAAFVSEQIKRELDWDDIRGVRDLWQGSLLIKGILSVGDARKAVALGADGIWVSNHGGRQLEAAPAAIDAVAPIRAAIGPDKVVVMDSGIRSGEDILRARMMGADFVFTARPFYYGAAAGAEAGVARAVEILSADVTRTLTQIGCPSWQALTADWRWTQSSE